MKKTYLGSNNAKQEEFFYLAKFFITFIWERHGLHRSLGLQNKKG